MPKVSDSKRKERSTVRVKTMAGNTNGEAMAYDWWNAKTEVERGQQALAVVNYLKQNQIYRHRQASIHARMYGNIPLSSLAGATFSAMGNKPANLPIDRPTMNVVQSCVDTLVSRLSQSKPRPVFLSDNADYKRRNLAKQMNRFTAGEFYQTKAYEKGESTLRKAAILGTGCLHIYESEDKKVALEECLLTELYVDLNDSFYGEPRALYRLKLIDRQVVANMFPDKKRLIETSEQAYPDAGGEAARTVADQIIVCEAWRLPSAKDATDGRHVITCSQGPLLDEAYKKDSFPFIFMHYSPRLVGFWGQGLTEQLAGTQIEINKLLLTISQSISLVGVPRVFVEEGSKVVGAHLDNQVGAIIKYRGIKPIYEVAPCVPEELYAQLQRLVDYAYQQSGISALAAASVKPQGLNSGEAIRNYDELQSDRFATLNKMYDRFYIDLSYKIIDLAKDIAERDGEYQTVYPDKDGTREINLPDAKFLEDPFIIQCFDSSSLPRDPAGRAQKVVEYMQSGVLSPAEGRRLLNFPDLEQDDKLAIAAEERILKQLDDIVESGKYDPPDPFTDLDMALQRVVQYYNLYMAAGLEESKAEKLRTYKLQVDTLKQMAVQAMQQQAMAAQGMAAGIPATPTPPPQSELMPQSVQ